MNETILEFTNWWNNLEVNINATINNINYSHTPELFMNVKVRLEIM